MFELAKILTAIQITNIGSWSWDMLKNSITWSDNLCQMHGIMPNEFDGKIETPMSFIHPKIILGLTIPGGHG
ncbi:MAG: PAS domain-containing protein [Deltaproteobacteria bacterium]|nr:PAS domain-containing protein [Deltaproteobacteria bacterium]